MRDEKRWLREDFTFPSSLPLPPLFLSLPLTHTYTRIHAVRVGKSLWILFRVLAEQIEANIIHNSRLSKRAKRDVYYSRGRILGEATRVERRSTFLRYYRLPWNAKTDNGRFLYYKLTISLKLLHFQAQCTRWPFLLCPIVSLLQKSRDRLYVFNEDDVLTLP